MSAAAAGLSADAEATLDFMTGLSAGGTLILQGSGWSWDPNVTGSTVYDGNAWAHTWGGGVAGTPASVTYALDGLSTFTAGEQSIIAASLALWSAESGISFAPVAQASAQVVFYRFGSADDPGSAPGVYTDYVAPNGSFGAASIPATTSAFVSIDTSQRSWSRLDSFSAFGGYGVETVVHEIGHVLGLFHTGPYNGTVDPLTQQYNSTDSRQWSLMSYINPWTSAKYASRYIYPQTYWGASPDGFAREPTTPMPLDILAAQRLYGLPTDTPLSGGQVFGFNCNIEGAIRPFFDFTTNATPVITLWDAGTGNALDLSGFGGASTVDLRPGTFSSTAGMVNNIGIAYGTRIDSLVGSRGGVTVTLNSESDTVRGIGGSNLAVLPGKGGLYAIDAGAGATTIRAAGGTHDVLLGIQGVGFTGHATAVAAGGVGTFALTGGGNLLYLGGETATVRSAGADTLVGGAGGMTVADTGTVGSVVFGAAGPVFVTGGRAADTVVTGSGGGFVQGGAGGAFVWATAPLVYLGGSGSATVAAGAAASVTVRGSYGGGLFVGGAAGHNVLAATKGAATLVGGGAGDQLVAQNAADNVLAAGAGAETLYAVGATGRNLFFAGSDTVAMLGGSGRNVFVAGAGAATVTAGAGTALLEAIAGHAGGSLTVTGWNPATDHLALFGYATGEAAQAVAGASTGAAGTTITLSDQTRILFADLRGANLGWFV